jgi:hypothetical protein
MQTVQELVKEVIANPEKSYQGRTAILPSLQRKMDEYYNNHNVGRDVPARLRRTGIFWTEDPFPHVGKLLIVNDRCGVSFYLDRHTGEVSCHWGSDGLRKLRVDGIN